MDSKDLKIQALLEKIQKISSDAADTEADLRVAVTRLNEQNGELRDALAEANERINADTNKQAQEFNND